MSGRSREGDSGSAGAHEKAQQHARRQLPKRFYKTVSVVGDDRGHAICLDGRPVRTPARNALMLPSKEAADLVAAEFERQEAVIDPSTMPLTRLANTTIDGIAADPQPVLEDVLRFASSDLICYRAAHPDALIFRQNEAWDPVVDWARQELGANMALAEGVMHVGQPREAMAAIGSRLKTYGDPFLIAALHVMTTLTGSALLAIAVVEGYLEPEEAWKAAHVDEDWNISQWGEDAEAAERRAQRRTDMMASATLVRALAGAK